MKTQRLSLSKIGVIGVPYNTGSKGENIEKGAESLRNAGIVNVLKRFSTVTDFGDLTVALPPADCSNPKLLKPNQVEVLCRALADRAKTAVAADCLPFIVGGDCSVLMGAIEGVRSLNQSFGLVYMGAHEIRTLPKPRLRE